MTSQCPENGIDAADAIDQLAGRVQSRLNGRVRDVRLVLRGPGLILQGHVPTYYAKQLVHHAVMEVTALPVLANEIEVS